MKVVTTLYGSIPLRKYSYTITKCQNMLYIVQLDRLCYTNNMSYKYPFLKKVAYYIREGYLSGDADIEEIIEFWVKHHKKKKHYVWDGKPRFYNRAMTANSRSRRLGDGSKVTADDLEFVFSRDGGQCKRCGTTDNLVFDHVIPYYRGGTNVIDNLQLLCKLCNMEKGVG